MDEEPEEFEDIIAQAVAGMDQMESTYSNIIFPLLGRLNRMMKREGIPRAARAEILADWHHRMIRSGLKDG